MVEASPGRRRRPWVAMGIFAVCSAVAGVMSTVVHRHQQRHRRLGHNYHIDIEDDVPLIEFAVTGFPKTGTSYLLRHLLNTEETFMGEEEHCLSSSGISTKISMYRRGRMTEDGTTRIKNGLKCPRDLEDVHGLANYEKFFPSTNFIVSLRHPILWFQSFYNYKVRHHAGEVSKNGSYSRQLIAITNLTNQAQSISGEPSQSALSVGVSVVF